MIVGTAERVRLLCCRYSFFELTSTSSAWSLAESFSNVAFYIRPLHIHYVSPFFSISSRYLTEYPPLIPFPRRLLSRFPFPTVLYSPISRLGPVLVGRRRRRMFGMSDRRFKYVFLSCLVLCWNGSLTTPNLYRLWSTYMLRLLPRLRLRFCARYVVFCLYHPLHPRLRTSYVLPSPPLPSTPIIDSSL